MIGQKQKMGVHTSASCQEHAADSRVAPCYTTTSNRLPGKHRVTSIRSQLFYWMKGQRCCMIRLTIHTSRLVDYTSKKKIILPFSLVSKVLENWVYVCKFAQKERVALNLVKKTSNAGRFKKAKSESHAWPLESDLYVF